MYMTAWRTGQFNGELRQLTDIGLIDRGGGNGALSYGVRGYILQLTTTAVRHTADGNAWPMASQRSRELGTMPAIF